MTNKPDHVGHRDRLRERFLNTGPEALADYELLELVLFMALPRRDTKPIAKALLERFGSFAGVISADLRCLGKVKGMGRSGVGSSASRRSRQRRSSSWAMRSWTSRSSARGTNC